MSKKTNRAHANRRAPVQAMQAPAIETVTVPAMEQASDNPQVAGDHLPDLAPFGAQRAESYEQISSTAQTATEQLNAQFAEARDGAVRVGLKLLEVAKEDTDATYAAMRELMTVKSPIEAFDIAARYWRGRIETRIATAQDLGAFVRKAADDAVRPLRERMEKFTSIAA